MTLRNNRSPCGDAGQPRYSALSTSASSLQEAFAEIAERFEALAKAENSHTGRFAKGQQV